jgi:sugar phosphate isomerase/epimerase
MRLGISTFAYAWSIGVPGFPVPEKPVGALDFLKEAAMLGLHLVQFGDNLALHELSEQELNDIRIFSLNNDLAIETGTRGLKDGIVDRYLHIASYFSSRILRIVIDQKGYEPAIPEIIGMLKKWEPVARTLGVIIAVENHDRFTCDDLIGIIKAVDSPFVRICLDTVNSFGALEGPAVVIDKLAPFTENVHIKDFKISRPYHNMGFIVEGTPAGSGSFDLSLIVNNKAVKAETAVLELWTPPEADIEMTIKKEKSWIIESLVNLSGLFNT